MSESVRAAIGAQLTGDVLEIGPGSVPFPTAPDARVVYADRSVPGGRDANWPELAGEPSGPDGDYDLDLDADGLRQIPDASFDAVVASHVIEHLANPVAALAEFHRVLRPGGRLVLIVPDRSRTFDCVREPTSVAHVLAEQQRSVTAVDDAHIREFCEAVFSQPSIHPEPVRSWHDPAALDSDLLELHRRRSIHVHVWLPEEFAAMLATTQAVGLGAWTLVSHYLVDDDPGGSGIEFGLVLQVPPVAPLAQDAAVRFTRDWSEQLLADPRRDPLRLVGLTRSLVAAAAEHVEVGAAASEPTAALAASARRAAASVAAEQRTATEARVAAQQQVQALLQSRTYRAGRAVTAPLRLLRGGRPGGRT